ncbi:MAG: restriction endonuclease [Chloroflexi bacterium]|nr:restriction endonuclease [Chloroflexota bacterium]
MAKRTTVADLLQASLLVTGEELVCQPRKGEVHRATLNSSGLIEYQGKVFHEPSAWATVVAGNNRNGWREVTARGRPLADFREMLPPEDPPPPPEPPQPPVETIGTAEDTMLSRLRSLTPTQFEHLVVEYLRRKGFANVKATGGPGDRGIDGEGELLFLKLRVIVQAKRYNADNPVRPPQIRELKGSLGNKFHRGVFITTSSFTEGAKEEAADSNDTIVTIDGPQLAKDMVEMQLGVKPVAVSVAIDEDFFASLGNP